MTPPITEFNGRYAFLSNFWREHNGSTVENVFQSMKTTDLIERKRILDAPTPGEAKRLGRGVLLRGDWDEVKLGIMYEAVRDKFKDPELAAKLLATGDAELIEGNSWNDTYWGVNKFTGVGENWLGVTLMQVRAAIKASQSLPESPTEAEEGVDETTEPDYELIQHLRLVYERTQEDRNSALTVAQVAEATWRVAEARRDEALRELMVALEKRNARREGK